MSINRFDVGLIAFVLAVIGMSVGLTLWHPRPGPQILFWNGPPEVGTTSPTPATKAKPKRGPVKKTYDAIGDAAKTIAKGAKVSARFVWKEVGPTPGRKFPPCVECRHPLTGRQEK